MCITKNHSIIKKNYFIHYYIETFLPRDNFFDILLVFVSFLQTYYDIYSSHILFLFFSSLDKILYLSLACSLNLFYHFHNNLLLYLVSCLGFFDNKLNQHFQWNCIHSFLYVIKKLQNTDFINQIRTIHYFNYIIFAHIPKTNSVSTSLNNIIENSQHFALNHDNHCKDMVHT